MAGPWISSHVPVFVRKAHILSYIVAMTSDEEELIVDPLQRVRRDERS